MNEENFNWDNFKRSIIVKSDIETCYQMIATSEGIVKWFIGEAIYNANSGNPRSIDEFIQKGDTYYWKWYHKELEITGKVLETNGKDLIKFTFGDAGTVSFKLINYKERVLVELKQEVYPGKTYDKFAHINCYVCWSFFLINLKSVVENGIDLREIEAEIDSLANW